jgi:hypothetical protein
MPVVHAVPMMQVASVVASVMQWPMVRPALMGPSMLDAIEVGLMVELAMQLGVLTVRHRMPVGLAMIQFSVKGPVL